MQKQIAVGQIDARTVEGVLNALMQVTMRGQGFAKFDFAARFVKASHVSEGATDIDRNAQCVFVLRHSVDSLFMLQQSQHCARCPSP